LKCHIIIRGGLLHFIFTRLLRGREEEAEIYIVHRLSIYQDIYAI